MNRTKKIIGLSAALAIAAGVALSQTDPADETTVEDGATADAAYEVSPGILSDDELKVCYPDPDFEGASSEGIIQALETETVEAETGEEPESFMTDEEIDGLAGELDIDAETVRGVAETLGRDTPDGAANLTRMLDEITGDALKVNKNDGPVLE